MIILGSYNKSEFIRTQTHMKLTTGHDEIPEIHAGHKLSDKREKHLR